MRFLGLVAQLARASRLHRGGRGFESRRVHHSAKGVVAVGKFLRCLKDLFTITLSLLRLW